MSVTFVKLARDIAQKKYTSAEFNQYIKVMADYSLAIAQQVKADPVVCMTASFLHKMADGVTGNYRSNLINPVLRDIGFEAKFIDAINSCIDNLLPEQKSNRQSLEERVVGDAYILTYWESHFGNRKEIPTLEFEASQKIFQKVEF